MTVLNIHWLRLATLITALLMSSSVMALNCRDRDSSAINLRHAIGDALRVARNTPDYLITWTSAKQTINLRCDNEVGASADETLYLYPDPGARNDSLEGMEFGILYADTEYWGTTRIDSQHRFRAAIGPQNFALSFRILLRKRPFRSALPVSSMDEFDLFRLDGERALSIAGNYSYTLTGLHTIRFVECMPLLPGQPATPNGTAPRGIASGGGALYQAGFESRWWSGSLTRNQLQTDAAGNLRINPASDWDAASRISSDPDLRHIYTAVRGADPATQTTEFRYKTLTTAQANFFATTPVGGHPDFSGIDRIAYLRGERAHESGFNNFRPRNNLLGDIVNSSVLYVGPPSALLPAALRSRPPAIYVGANDGMLHAFDAKSGAELFSYIPQMLINKLRALTAIRYAHQAYVDGALATAEVPVATSTAWRTVLVAGLGGGAPGAVALDISDPGTFSRNGVLWEFSNRDDADMGHLTSTPVIARFNLGTAAKPDIRHFAILATGPRNVYPDDASGPGILFLLALEQPVTRWTEGVNYFKLKTVPARLGYGNALATPGLVLAADGTVDTLYTGDLLGNMWRFKFSAVHSPAQLAAVTPTRLFLSRDASGRPQPITTRPQVLHAPHNGFLVLFGTGKMVSHSDLNPATFQPQSFYAVRDLSGDYNRTRADLLARALTPAGDDGFAITGEALAYENDLRLGWYIDFPDAGRSGERVIYDPLVVQGQLVFNSLSAGATACQPPIGRSYRLNALTGVNGEATGLSHRHGLLGTPIAHSSGSGSDSAGAVDILAAAHGSDGKPTAKILHHLNVTRTRKSWGWKEIPNWRDLRRDAGTSAGNGAAPRTRPR